jgi:prepilin-type N-terminal cleavage/methylation domain-containing protein
MNPRPTLFSFRNPNFEIRISNSPPAFRHATSTPFIFLTPSPLKPLIPRRPPAGFSLTEVVIALGIFAVSMVGVIALFPVASSAGRESSEETQAAILAQTIFSDLRSSTQAKGKSAGWIVRGPDTFNANQWIRPISLTTGSTNYVGYDLIPRVNSSGPDGTGMIGQPICLKAINQNLSATAFSNAITVSNAIFAAQIAVNPVPGLTGLAQVNVSVQTPANVVLTNRRSYVFQSLLYAP